MSKSVHVLKKRVPGCCLVTRCDRDGCGLSLQGTPPERVIIDMDCDALGIPDNQNRCDFLFVCKQNERTIWVVPIELKSGDVKSVNEVVKQLEGGAKKADAWLLQSAQFQFVPVLAHGKSIHKADLRKLRSQKIQLRGKPRKIALVKCGDRLTEALCT